MKNKILFFLTLLWLPLAAQAGDIKPGAVPGSINYQGRLERDNAPITGVIHLFFRIYNASSGGLKRWESPELIVTAAQGIFSANITPPWDVFSRSETLYLEVQVESDVLTPREPLNSVAYALVAKKLEDGASISVTTLTAANQVSLATAPYANVNIGSIVPGNILNVSGEIHLNGNTSQICFNDTSCMGSAGLGSAVGGVSASGVSTIQSGTGGAGEMHFNTANTERMRMTDNANGGTIAIGPAAILSPKGGAALDIAGSLYVGNAGIYDRDDTELNVKQNLVVEGGHLRGVGQNYLSIGETADTIVAATGNTPHVWLDPAGNVGVGLPGPTEPVHAAGNIRSNTGVRGGAVSLGGYTGWTSAANEVRAQNGSHLLLQQNNPFNVGIGTDTPREKLHVRGSVLADYGVMAATAAFAGDVGVNGNFTANGYNKQVFLTSTTIYGTLQVTGGIGSMAGFPAYIASTQTLTGQNTFANQVVVSSDVMTPSRLGVAMKDFNFGAGRYLQVGDNKAEYSAQNTVAYLVGGDAANARLAFYRGAALAGSLETQNGSNLALVVGGQAKTLTDSVYHRIQNSVVWISTGFNTTPAIYVSSQMGNVGIGTAVADPTYKLTVNGSLRFSGPASNGIVFADGSTMISATTLGTAQSIANPGDAVVAANTLGGGGSVVLRSGSLDGLVVDSSGRVGVGTLYPVSKLNVRGGDLVLGTPVNPYSGGPENLIVAGNIVFDGALVQRSLIPTQLSGLVVASDVYLSTTTGARTGIGTSIPGFTLDVSGDINASGALRTGGTARISAAGTVGSGGANASWDGAIIGANRGGTGADLSAVAKGGVPYFSAAGVLSGLTAGTANYLLQANGAGVNPSWVQSVDTNVGGTIVRRDVSGNFAGNTITAVGFSGPISGNVTGNVSGSAATVTAAAQPAITSVGTLTGLTMGGNIVMGNNSITGANSVTATTFNGALTGNVTGNVSGSAGTAGTVTTAAQPSITSVGTLTGLTMGGNIVMGNNSITGANSVTATTFNGALTGNVTGNVSGSAATVTAGAQPNITSLGTLSGLTVTAAISGSVTGSAATVTAGAQPNITSVGTLSGLTVTAAIAGSVTGSAATVTAAAQPNITSVGTLTGLTVTAPISGSVTGSAATAGTVTAAAQPNITSVGTLTGLTVTAAISGSVTGTAANVTGTVAVGNGGTGITGGTAGQVICWKTATSLGMCATAPSGTGSCTCN